MPAVPRSKVALWLGAFAGFYRPGVEALRLLDPVSKFLYAPRPFDIGQTALRRGA